MRMTLALAAVLALSACSKPAETMPGESTGGTETAAPAANTAEAAPAAAEDPAKVALVQCAVCHKFTAAEGNSLGPNLAGVVGSKAGTVAGFAYSPAMKDSGKTWDEATLNAYLEKPMAFIPGNRMAFAGETNPTKRAAIIEALKGLK